jgi:FkbM family methyltransferase
MPGMEASSLPPASLLEKLERIRLADEHLNDVRQALWSQPAGAMVMLGKTGYEVRITDGPNAYMQYKDVFIRGIYRFATDASSPVIIDGGGNMGISVLGFKQDHPESRVTVFEPDAAIGALLRENLVHNRMERDVTIVPTGLASYEGKVSFAADASAGGQITETGTVTIDVVPLSRYIDGPVDFVKLNIEGQELAVLQELEQSGKIGEIKRIVLEYHGWAGGTQFLGDVLNLLDRCGFRYLVHDFDNETNTVTKPPFRYRPKANWFCLVYGERV